MNCTIVTPSYRQLDWLACCIASVADQEGVTVEHIVQDAGTEGFAEFAEKMRQRWPDREGYQRIMVSEKDGGMYDAVNRGLRRARGDWLAYLNCDEQYLPGALAQVAEEFRREPRTEVMFAGCLVTDERGCLLAARPACPLSEAFIRTCHLPNFTASMFFRKDWFQRRDAWFDASLRDVADAGWVLARLRERSRVRVVKFFTTTFADTGANMNLAPNARQEHRELQASAPRWMRILRPWWVFCHRLGKMLRGEYVPRHWHYRIYSKDQVKTRVGFEARWAGGVWWNRLFLLGSQRPRAQRPI